MVLEKMETLIQDANSVMPTPTLTYKFKRHMYDKQMQCFRMLKISASMGWSHEEFLVPG